jgi:hypothetical protein
VLRFGRLTAPEVAKILTREHGLTDTEARAAAADADGSVGVALELQGSDVAEARDVAREMLERASRVKDPVRLLDLAKDLTGRPGTPAEERERLTVHLRALSSLLRDVSILAMNGDVELLANSDLQVELGRFAKTFGPERSEHAFEAVDEALDAVQRNASPKMVADWLMVQI